MVPPHALGVAVLVEVADPVRRHPALALLLKLSELAAGALPQVTVTLAGGALNVGSRAGDTVIVLETGASALPHASLAAHVSTMVPPQAPGVAVLVEVADPVSRQPAPPLFVKLSELAAGAFPQVTVTLAGGALNVGSRAGDTVIVLDTGASGLPQISVAFHVSTMVPPQAPAGDCADKVELADPLMRQPAPPLFE